MVNVKVINLDRSPDRWKAISANLTEFGIEHSRFAAIDGKKLSSDDISQKVSWLGRNLLCNKAIIGTWMSHKKILEEFLAHDRSQFLVVLEDDAKVTEDYVKVINNLDEIYYHLKFDYLNLHPFGINKSFKEYKKVGDYTYSNSMLVSTALAYVVSKEGAVKLNEFFSGQIIYHVDVEIMLSTFISDLSYWSVREDIISATGAETTIGVHQGGVVPKLLNFFNFKRLEWVLTVPVFTVRLNNVFTVYSTLLLAMIYTSYHYGESRMTYAMMVELFMAHNGLGTIKKSIGI